MLTRWNVAHILSLLLPTLPDSATLGTLMKTPSSGLAICPGNSWRLMMTTERVLILCIILTVTGCASSRKMSPLPAPAAAQQALLNSTPGVSEFNREAYDHIVDNPFVRVSQDPLSTFSIDVDTA